MSDLSNQKISQYLDGDLSAAESMQLLGDMQQQPQLQQTLQRYKLIQQVLKARPVLSADATFAAEIQAKLAQEPHYLLPKKSPQAQSSHAYRTVAWALAASLVAAVVIVPRLKNMNAGVPATTMAVAQQENIQTQAQEVRLNEAALEALIMQHELQSVRFDSINRQQASVPAYASGLYTNGAVDLQYHRGQLANYGSGE